MGEVLGPLAQVGESWVQVGGFGGHLGLKLNDIGSSWGGLGCQLSSNLKGLGAISAPSCGALILCWAFLGPKCGQDGLSHECLSQCKGYSLCHRFFSRLIIDFYVFLTSWELYLLIIVEAKIIF